MTREQVNQILREMEAIRMDSYEADSPAEEKRLIASYDRLWKSIAPYVEGKKKHKEETEKA